jgi:ditrans,polycis-polyprenyl diphosphate synthase
VRKMAQWMMDRFEDAVAAVLRQGACPQHVAFIMDGNRRFARGKGLSVPEGHKQGYMKLQETLQWCLRLGVKVVTVYAFSIDNFNRTQDEVDALMNLAEEKFDQIIREEYASLSIIPFLLILT